MKSHKIGVALIAAAVLSLISSRSLLAQTLPPADIAPAASETILACQTGDAIELSGSATLTGDLDTCLFQVDNATLESHGAAAGSDTYHFRWTANSAGDHTLKVVYTGQGHRKAAARTLIVLVADTPFVAFQSLPTSAAVDTAVTVTGMSARFVPARTDFTFDGQPLTPSSPLTATLPLSAKLLSGSYPLRFVAYDAAGRVFYSRTAQIVVPARFKILAPPEFTLQKPDDRALLTADILPVIKAAKVAYFWAAAGSDDWKPLAEVSVAPFSTAFDLSALPSGDYQVKATLTTAAGIAYEGDPVPIKFQNAMADEKTAREAKEKADLEAAAAAQAAKQQADAVSQVADAEHTRTEKLANLSHFVPRPGYDEQVFRRQIGELAFASPPAHSGVVGLVQDLSILQAADGKAGQAARQTGLPLPVSAVVSAGTGRLNSGANAAQAAQLAAEYCRTKTIATHWNWSQHDITLYLPNFGSSASTGLAAAVAVLSAASGHPVDIGVAMSGQIDGQGEVRPAPGVVYNAEAVFSGTPIQTLIIPANAIHGDFLFSLYTHNPALCFNRRVLLVHTVDAAANYALLRWPSGSASREEQLIDGGLRHFVAGDDALASAAFRAASDLDPDNWTAGFWLTMVGLVEQQKHPVGIASAPVPPK